MPIVLDVSKSIFWIDRQQGRHHTEVRSPDDEAKKNVFQTTGKFKAARALNSTQHQSQPRTRRRSNVSLVERGGCNLSIIICSFIIGAGADFTKVLKTATAEDAEIHEHDQGDDEDDEDGDDDNDDGDEDVNGDGDH